ncbi:magnesium/cobalt transporter CorA [Rhodothermus bifroesti]|uniref:Magnesium transport protein CorA n=1 Tax=Rhodothermus marinus TaxID=29549 RepID=A0A7V2AZ13_RHOMR|nr:magnesium/cobalt transporter CorA [Rhodothermus bifroesti]GBD00821.1 Cobalt/magnesium transport protein CorA [bacterium HR18]
MTQALSQFRHMLARRRRKVGLPPGTLLPPEVPPTEPVTLHLIAYDAEQLFERSLRPDELEGVLAETSRPAVTWIDVTGLHDIELIHQLGKLLSIHPLTLEDIVSIGQRPKFEEGQGYLYVVCHMLTFNEVQGLVEAEQISLILTQDLVLTLQERPGDVFDPIRVRLRQQVGRLRQRDASYLAYALLDVVVDHYFVVLEAISERAEQLEAHILEDPSPQVQRALASLRRELIAMRRAVWPLREVFSELQRLESPLLAPETRTFLRDTYDHVVQVIDIIESLRELLAGLTDVYLSRLSHRMNEIMKVLTMVGTIFIPLTFLAGIYGMNFRYMPELEWRYGYPAVLLLMLGLGLGMLYGFWRRGWL